MGLYPYSNNLYSPSVYWGLYLAQRRKMFPIEHYEKLELEGCSNSCLSNSNRPLMCLLNPTFTYRFIHGAIA